MTHTAKRTIAVLAALLFSATSAAAAKGVVAPTSVNIQQMKTAITSFGVTESVSATAAAAAIQVIKQRDHHDTKNNPASVSLVPDDLLNISPYD